MSTLAAGYLQDGVGLDVRQTTAVMAGFGVVIGLLWVGFYVLSRRWAREMDAELHAAVPVGDSTP